MFREIGLVSILEWSKKGYEMLLYMFEKILSTSTDAE